MITCTGVSVEPWLWCVRVCTDYSTVLLWGSLRYNKGIKIKLEPTTSIGDRQLLTVVYVMFVVPSVMDKHKVMHL